MDMVGHTGVFSAAVTACETVDFCVGKIIPSFLNCGGVVLITADHGNSEKMMDDKGAPFTAHTTNPVPLIIIGLHQTKKTLSEGKLADIAPTILSIMGIKAPFEMTGKPLFISS